MLSLTEISGERLGEVLLALGQHVFPSCETTACHRRRPIRVEGGSPVPHEDILLSLIGFWVGGVVTEAVDEFRFFLGSSGGR